MSYAIRKDGKGWRAVNGPGDVGADETYSTSQPIPSDSQNRSTKWDEIKAERDRRKIGGFKVGAHWFHSDAESKTQHLANKDTARDQLATGGKLSDMLLDPLTSTTIPWKAMSGDFVVLTCQLAFDIVAAAKASEFATFTTAETHKAAMMACADPSAYDFSSGWPKIFTDELLP